MLRVMATWLGVDVGGTKKGFDAALVGDSELFVLAGGLSCGEVLTLVSEKQPTVVAIDSPRSCAPDGSASRAGERCLNKAVCKIRWTPDAARVHAEDYYGWIVEGLQLYKALV